MIRTSWWQGGALGSFSATCISVNILHMLLIISSSCVKLAFVICHDLELIQSVNKPKGGECH